MSDCNSCSIEDKIAYCCRTYHGYRRRGQPRQHIVKGESGFYQACAYLTDEGKCELYPVGREFDRRPKICGDHKCNKSPGIEGKISEPQTP